MSGPLDLVRPDLRALKPYSPGISNRELVRLHTNEAHWRSPGDDSEHGLNRYPESRANALRSRLADLYGIDSERVLVTRGSDDGIDVLLRAFCRAGKDRIAVCPPTFGMYAVAAGIQGARVRDCPLRRDDGFSVNADAILDEWDDTDRLLFLCSPNNPTGNTVDAGVVESLCTALSNRGVVVVDEAYIEFAATPSLTLLLDKHPNLVVLRTLSKAFALAGARCGAVLGAPELVAFLDRLLPPYPLATPTLESVNRALDPANCDLRGARIEAVLRERSKLARALADLDSIVRVWPSEGNYLLCEVDDARCFLAAGIEGGFLLRDFSDKPQLENCVRITVGSPEQNAALLRVLTRTPSSAETGIPT